MQEGSLEELRDTPYQGLTAMAGRKGIQPNTLVSVGQDSSPELQIKVIIRDNPWISGLWLNKQGTPETSALWT